MHLGGFYLTGPGLYIIPVEGGNSIVAAVGECEMMPTSDVFYSHRLREIHKVKEAVEKNPEILVKN